MSIPKEIEEILKNAEQLQEPKINDKIVKSCENCMELIVCWAYEKIEETEDEAEEEIKDVERAKNCPYWKPDIMTYQKLIAEKEDNKKKTTGAKPAKAVHSHPVLFSFYRTTPRNTQTACGPGIGTTPMITCKAAFAA